MFMEASKVEVRLAASEVLKAMQLRIKNEKIWKWTDVSYQQDEIKRITSSSS
jgi:hypothetical protein